MFNSQRCSCFRQLGNVFRGKRIISRKKPQSDLDAGSEQRLNFQDQCNSIPRQTKMRRLLLPFMLLLTSLRRWWWWWSWSIGEPILLFFFLVGEARRRRTSPFDDHWLSRLRVILYGFCLSRCAFRGRHSLFATRYSLILSLIYISLSIYLIISLSNHLPIYLCIYLSIHRSVHVFIRLSICYPCTSSHATWH